MKILYMHTCFELPKDFTGDLNDALQKLIDYRKKADVPGNPEGSNTGKVDSDIWSNFLAGRKEGYKFIGHYSLQEEDGDKWKNL